MVLEFHPMQCERVLSMASRFILSSTGIAYASLYSAGLTGTVQTRRAQLQALKMSAVHG